MRVSFRNGEDDGTRGDLAGDGLAGGKSPPSCILTINGGSSSLKFAVFATADSSQRVFWGRVERVGRGNSRLVVTARRRSVGGSPGRGTGPSCGSGTGD